MKKFVFLLAFVFALGLFVGQAAAQEGGPTPSPDEVNAIAKNLYCPVCANVPLDTCGSAACIQWRQQIADLLAEGRTEQEIYALFVRQYGPVVLAVPPASGFGWLIYVLPPLVLVTGAVLLWRSLAAWRPKQAVSSARPDKPVDDKYAQRLEDELKARR